jgi:hypothetical protein
MANGGDVRHRLMLRSGSVGIRASASPHMTLPASDGSELRRMDKTYHAAFVFAASGHTPKHSVASQVASRQGFTCRRKNRYIYNKPNGLRLRNLQKRAKLVAVG